MSRLVEPRYLGLRVRIHNLLGNLGGDVAILATQDEELAQATLAEHLILIRALHHATQQCHDALVLGDIDLLGQIVNI